MRTGRIPAGAAPAAGVTVRLWVDTAGLPTGPPPSSSALVANQVLAAAGSHRAGDRAVVAGMGGAVGARPATASRLGSGMGCCRPSVDPALLVTGSALTAGRLATSRSAHRGADHRSARPGWQRRERKTMTAAPPDDLGRQGVRSLEVRWIFPGQLAGAVTGWFVRFLAETTELEDAYLLHPHLPGLSVKVRGRRALEVKAYRGSPGLLEVAGRARGRVESWQKWGFPHGPPSPGSGYQAGWRPVRKRRRISWFSQATGVGVPRRARSHGVRWNSPRSMCMASRGGPWALRPPAPPMRCTANSTPPPRSYSPRLSRMAWNWGWVTPGPTHSGCADSPVPGNT